MLKNVMFMQIMNTCDIIWILPAASWRFIEAVWQPTGRDHRANEIRVGIKNAAEGSCPVLYPMTRLTFIHRWKELLTPLTGISIHAHTPFQPYLLSNCNRVTRHQWRGRLSMVQTSVMNVKAMNSWRLGVREGRGSQSGFAVWIREWEKEKAARGTEIPIYGILQSVEARWDETEDACSFRLSVSF